MKRLLLLLCTVCTISFLQGQITLDASALPQAGESYSYAQDTFATNVNVGIAGPDQMWDFSELTRHEVNTNVFVNPNNTPTAKDFPSSNLAIDLEVAYNYLEVNDTAMLNLGIAGDLFGIGQSITAINDPVELVYQIPTNYGDAFSDTYGIDITVDGSFANVDSVRLKQIVTVDVVVDAYGMLTTPGGTFETLRLRRTTASIDSIWVQVLGFEQLAQTNDNPPTTVLEFLAEGVGGTAATVELDADGLPVSASFWFEEGPSAPTANFILASQSSQEAIEVQVSDASTTNTTEWLWDFGDGNTSSMQNPTYTYSEAGTYTICLTASNDIGSNTYCEDFTFALVPIPSFSSEIIDNGLLQFTDATTQEPTMWSWDFGDGNTSTEQNPEHTFAESGTYTVCLTAANSGGEATVCEEIMLEVLSTGQLEDEKQLQVSPNPAHDFINIKALHLGISSAELIIHDALGNKMCNFKVSANEDLQIGTREWPSGIYYYHLYDKQGDRLERGQIAIIK